MVTDKEIKRYMMCQVQDGEYVDPITGEVQLTQLAEAAAWESNLDLEDERPFELAFEVGEWFAKTQASSKCAHGTASGAASNADAPSSVTRHLPGVSLHPHAVQYP